MIVSILSLLLVVGVSADHHPMKSKGKLSNSISIETGSQCDSPFQAVGSNCFFFSEEQKLFDEAQLHCESLGDGEDYEVTLAMLDYEEAEFQALFDVVVTKNNTFWVGGKSEDRINWKWLNNQTINLQATFWYCDEPTQEQNFSCAAIQTSTYSPTKRDLIRRPYLYAHNCSESLNFICQTTSHVNFRRIGNHYYFISEEAGVPRASWWNARDFCQSLAVPGGYYADLAVLGLPNQDSYSLLENLVEFCDDDNTWIGAYAESDCNYQWVDGRELPESFLYWNYNQPSCGGSTHVAINRYALCNRVYLADSLGPMMEHSFICQLFEIKDE